MHDIRYNIRKPHGNDIFYRQKNETVCDRLIEIIITFIGSVRKNGVRVAIVKRLTLPNITRFPRVRGFRLLRPKSVVDRIITPYTTYATSDNV